MDEATDEVSHRLGKIYMFHVHAMYMQGSKLSFSEAHQVHAN